MLNTDPIDPIDPAEPIDPTDPALPIDPTDPELPIDPMDPAEPMDPIDPALPRDPTLPADGVAPRPIGVTDPGPLPALHPAHPRIIPAVRRAVAPERVRARVNMCPPGPSAGSARGARVPAPVHSAGGVSVAGSAGSSAGPSVGQQLVGPAARLGEHAEDLRPLLVGADLGDLPDGHPELAHLGPEPVRDLEGLVPLLAERGPALVSRGFLAAGVGQREAAAARRSRRR